MPDIVPSLDNAGDESLQEYLISRRLIYNRLIEVLSGIKLVGGNIFLNKTIHNHPQVKDFLLNYLKDDLIKLEREILELESK